MTLKTNNLIIIMLGFRTADVNMFYLQVLVA